MFFEKLKKKFAALQCHTQLGNARVQVRAAPVKRKNFLDLILFCSRGSFSDFVKLVSKIHYLFLAKNCRLLFCFVEILCPILTYLKN